MGGLALIFLMLFCLVLFGTYVIIRRELLTIRTAAGLCAAGTVSSIAAFGLAENLGLLHALVAGMVVGSIFTGAVVAMAAFFQVNQPRELERYLSDERASPD